MPTKPAAGVMATRPATAPEAAPRVVGLPWNFHSANTQASMAVAAATCVVTKAFPANPSAARALPALKPNQPNHKRAVPIMVMGRLCGKKERLPHPLRLPMTKAAARAALAELMCTTRPACEIHCTHLGHPAPTPDPVAQGGVDKSTPEHDENDKG